MSLSHDECRECGDARTDAGHCICDHAAEALAAARLWSAGLRDPNVIRDRWQEARLGAALHFHADREFVTANVPPSYWQGVYRRWSQLYQRSRELELTRGEPEGGG